MNRDEADFKNIILKAVENEMKQKTPPMSQSQLGELVGLTRIEINKILRGTVGAVSLQRTVDLARALKLKVSINIERQQ